MDSFGIKSPAERGEKLLGSLGDMRCHFVPKALYIHKKE